MDFQNIENSEVWLVPRIQICLRMLGTFEDPSDFEYVRDSEDVCMFVCVSITRNPGSNAARLHWKNILVCIYIYIQVSAKAFARTRSMLYCAKAKAL